MKTILITTASILALTTGAFAQETSVDWDGATQLDTLVVTTPLRRESSLERSTSSVTVIGEEQIRRSAALDLPSLLRNHAGVSLTANGGMGSRSGVSLRGFKPTQTLVLINGINARSATSGETSLFNIPLDSIERIEIAKGAHSAQYGSDAIGGVINVITKSGGTCANGNTICTTVSAGVSHPWGGHAGITTRGQTEDGIEFSFGGRVIGTRGYDFTTAMSEPDDDGFLQGSAHFSLGKEFDWGRLYADGLLSRSRTEYDASAPWADEAENSLFAGKVGVRVDHAPDWHSTVELFTGFDFQDNFRDGTDTLNVYDTTRSGIFASTTKTFDAAGAAHVLNVGIEAYREEISSTEDFGVTSRDVGAVFAQHSIEFDALTLDAGIRYDANEQYGSATTYNVGASYEFLPGLVGRASYATGFRAPTFNDLYNPWGANPDVQPEHSRSYEIGLQWRPTVDTVFDAAFYQTWLKDAITLDAMYIPQNLARVENTGFEASVSHRFNALLYGRAEVAFNDPTDSDTGLGLIRQDRFKATAEVGFAATEQLDLTAALVYVGPRNDISQEDFVSRIELPAYVTVDLSATYAFDDQTEFKFSVENLFDEHYETTSGYRSPGRSINVSLARTF
ncbi:TonB-dependent receptor [Mesorhizobium sp. CAU 1741]|uniref:TonB-dependent receptor domain-containing protein n=1 Tax=Mesorhizobium sp. CAU 1741 TaxID=3140366 RepID=UPI00325B57B4